jgi:hypothetical protein
LYQSTHKARKKIYPSLEAISIIKVYIVQALYLGLRRRLGLRVERGGWRGGCWVSQYGKYFFYGCLFAL